MASKTKIKFRSRKKTSPEIKQAIAAAIKSAAWKKVANQLSSSARNYSSLNLFEIDAQTSAGDTVVVVGKILSKGELTKKVKISALAISQKAKEKLKQSKSEFVPLIEEIKKNSKMEGVKILK